MPDVDAVLENNRAIREMFARCFDAAKNELVVGGDGGKGDGGVALSVREILNRAFDVENNVLRLR